MFWCLPNSRDLVKVMQVNSEIADINSAAFFSDFSIQTLSTSRIAVIKTTALANQAPFSKIFFVAESLKAKLKLQHAEVFEESFKRCPG